MTRKRKDEEEKPIRPKVNEELEGFEVKIDSFGEITSTFDIDKINSFLNKEVVDKKLKDREDLNVKKEEDE
jgi:hypothetical protein